MSAEELAASPKLSKEEKKARKEAKKLKKAEKAAKEAAVQEGVATEEVKEEVEKKDKKEKKEKKEKKDKKRRRTRRGKRLIRKKPRVPLPLLFLPKSHPRRKRSPRTQNLPRHLFQPQLPQSLKPLSLQEAAKETCQSVSRRRCNHLRRRHPRPYCPHYIHRGTQHLSHLE